MRERERGLWRKRAREKVSFETSTSTTTSTSTSTNTSTSTVTTSEISFNWVIFVLIAEVPNKTFGDWCSRIFTGQMLFVTHNEQCQSAEGKRSTAL